ncbi:unnamed protein product [Brassica rapa subsp. trilocularis]
MRCLFVDNTNFLKVAQVRVHSTLNHLKLRCDPSLQPVPHNFTCPADSKLDLISTINYPSIGVSGFKGNENKRVHRTVINVNIQATPEKLQFTKRW